MNTPLELKILEMLREAGDQWLSRREIAQRLGRRQLTPYDSRILRRLVMQGMIEGEIRPLGPKRNTYLYRLNKHRKENGAALHS